MTSETKAVLSSNTKLLPCPFCGSAAVIPDYANEHVGFYVACTATDCYACVGEGYDGSAMPDHVFSSPEEAATAWNRRVAPETSEQRRIALDEAYDLLTCARPAEHLEAATDEEWYAQRAAWYQRNTGAGPEMKASEPLQGESREEFERDRGFVKP